MILLPNYKHIINPRLKHTYLSFDERGTLIIKSPKVSQRYIEQLLLKKATWIEKSRQKIEHKKGKDIDFDSNLELYFLGESYLLTLIPYEKKRTTLDFDGRLFKIYYNNYNTQIFQKHIDTFYKKQALQYITPLVEQWSEKMSLSFSNISFRKTKRQWGSCSAKNNLSFNTMMMKLPKNVIQYIIVHELAHIQHKHHQKAFWQLVETYLPTYKTDINELKNYTT